MKDIIIMNTSTYKKICLFSGIRRLIKKTKDVDKYDILSVYSILADTIAVSAKFYHIYNLFDIKDGQNRRIRAKLDRFSHGIPLFKFTNNGLKLQIGYNTRERGITLMEMNSIMIDAVQGDEFPEVGPAARTYLADITHNFLNLHLIGQRNFTWDYIPVCATAYYLHEQTIFYSIRLMKLIKMHSFEIEKDCYSFLSNHKWKEVDMSLRNIDDSIRYNETLRAMLRAHRFKNTGFNLGALIQIIQDAISAFISLHTTIY